MRYSRSAKASPKPQARHSILPGVPSIREVATGGLIQVKV